jgi:hypothetical protein
MSAEQIGLGDLLSEAKTYVDRDAVHIAVVPVVAAEDLAPGAHVGRIRMATVNGKNLIVVGPVGRSREIGIIDPFLREPVLKGEQCWMCLYPLTVTGLRHHYTHPAFRELEAKEEEERRA